MRIRNYVLFMVLVPFQTASLLHGMPRPGRKHPQRKYVFFWFLLLSFLNYTSEAPHPACFPFHSPAEVSPCFTPGHLTPGRNTLQRNVFFMRIHSFSYSFSLKFLKIPFFNVPILFQHRIFHSIFSSPRPGNRQQGNHRECLSPPRSRQR